MKKITGSSKRWLLASMLVMLLLFVGVGSVQAVVIDRDGTLPAGDVVDDDLVLTATTVSMNGTVNGSLIAAGQTITVSGTVKSDAILAGQTVIISEGAVIEGNLFAGGSTVILRGKVLGSLFGGAGTLTLAEKASIGRNVYVGVYQLETLSGSKVGKDINAGGYQYILSGESRNLSLAGVAVELNGVVSGDATLYLGNTDQSNFMPDTYGDVRLPTRLPAGLRIASGAKVAGKLTYTSAVDQSGNIQAAPQGGIVFKTPVPYERERTAPQSYPWNPVSSFGAGLWVWDLLRNLVTILILGGLVMWLLPRLFQRGVDQLSQHPIGSIGIGFLALVLSFIAIPTAILVIVLVGLLFGVTTLFDLAGIWVSIGFTALGAACLAFVIVLTWAGKLLLSFIIGKWLFSKMLPNSTGRVWPFVTGAVIFALLAAIPIFGFLFSFVAALAGLGVMWYVLRRPAAPAPAVE